MKLEAERTDRPFMYTEKSFKIKLFICERELWGY